MKKMIFQRFLLSLFLLSATYSLYAGGGGGGGETSNESGFIENGNSTLCMGDELTMSLVTDLPNPKVTRWEIQRVGSSEVYQLVDSNNQNIWTETTASLIYHEVISINIRILYTSNGTSYYTQRATFVYRSNQVNPGTISPNQHLVQQFPPAEISGTDASSGSTSDGAIIYEWQKSIDQYNWQPIIGATSKNYTPQMVNTNTYYRRVAKNSMGYCPTESNIVSIEVLKASISGVDGKFCLGSRANSLTVNTQSSKSPTIQWQKNRNGGQWIDVAGATGRIFTPLEVVDGTYKYRAKVSWGSSTQTVETEAKEMIYFPAFSPGTISPPYQEVVEGVQPAELQGTMPSGGSGNYSYEWQIQRSVTTWDNLGKTSISYQPQANNAGTYRRFAVDLDGGCSAASNTAVIEVKSLNPGTIGHNATIGMHGRHKPLVSTSPTNGIEFKWEIRSSDDDQTYTEWASVRDWSSNQNYNPENPLPSVADTFVQYRRLARVESTGQGVESTNYIKIKISSTDPGSILIDPSRVSLVQYDTLGLIMQEPQFPTTPSAEKRFKWQQVTPAISEFQQMTDWGSDTTEYEEYRHNTPFENVGIYSFRRLFVQDVQNKDDPDRVFESNEVSVYVEALKGGTITIEDTTLLMRGDIPSLLLNVESGNGKYYKWQSRNPQDAPDVWTDLTGWIENNHMEYTPTEAMTEPQRQYRRLCKTLESTADNLAESSNVITVYAQAVDPGAISIDPIVVVLGGKVNLINVEKGSGDVFKWQVQRQNSDGTWGNWVNLSTDDFSEGEDARRTEEINVRTNSKYRRLSKLTIGEDNKWAAASNEVMVEITPLEAGEIGRSQDIVKGGVPSKFISIRLANGNGNEVYAWYRKKEGEAAFLLVSTAFANANDSYQETEPVDVTTYYRRIVKPLESSSINDTIGSNTIVITPSKILNPGSISISSIGTIDTMVNAGTKLPEFHNSSEGNGAVFKWQKKYQDSTAWLDVTPWGRNLTYEESSPISISTLYRRCAKAAEINPDDLIQYSNEIKITINNLNGGEISGDTTLNIGDVPGLFKNVRLGEATQYKWQKKIGRSAWVDIMDWNPDHLEYQEEVGISTTTYYRRLNKNENMEDHLSVSSNTIKIQVQELGTRDETVTAQNFYLTVQEVLESMNDDMLIKRSNAKGINNITFQSVNITTVVHNIDTQVGTYRATFSTEKGESRTVKVYVVENGFTPIDGIILFAHDFTLYTSELTEPVSSQMLVNRAEAFAYDVTTQTPISVTVSDREALDDAIGLVPPTQGTYPITFSSFTAELSVNVSVTSGELLMVNFDANFEDINGENAIESKEITTGQPYGTLPTPLRSGATFLYWSLDVEGLTPIDSATIVGSVPGTDVEHTLYAIWQYSVILDLNGGEGEEILLVQQYRPYQYFQQMPIPQRRGYRFVTWSLDLAGDFIMDGTFIVERGDEHILYAVWEAREITVIFEPAGGVVSPDRKIVTFGSEFGELPVPKYGYYKFKGWYMLNGSDEVLSTHIVDTVAAEISLYAKYDTYTSSSNDRYVITPNGDGLNDRFYLQFLWYEKNNVKDVSVYIYDRKGTMVYYNNKYQELDGEFDGSNLSDGTYIVAVHYTENDEKRVYNATLSILR